MKRHINTITGLALLGASLLVSLVLITLSVRQNSFVAINPLSQTAALTSDPVLIQVSSLDSGSQNFNIPFSYSNAVGNTIIVALRKAPPQTCSISDTLGNSYSLAATADEIGDHRNHLWYAKDIKSGSNTININCPQSGTARVAIHEFSGLDKTSPLGQTSTNTGNSTNPNTGNLTVSQSKELLFGFCSVDNVTSFSSGSGYSVAQSVSSKIATEYRTVSTLGTYNPSFSINPADVWTCIGATFKPVNTAASSADTTPPVISSVNVSNVSASSAIISWNTNEPATGQVEYGFTSAYGSNSLEVSSFSTSHSITLTGLLSNSIFNYRVKSRDSAGNTILSGNFSFVTPSLSLSQPVQTSNTTQVTTQQTNQTQQIDTSNQFVIGQNPIFTAASQGSQALQLTDFLSMDSGTVGSVVDSAVARASSVGTSGNWVNGPYYSQSVPHELKVATIPSRPNHGPVVVGLGSPVNDTSTNRGYVKKLTNASDAEYVDYVFNNPKPTKVSTGMYFNFSSNGTDKWNTGANPRYYDLFALTATDGMFITLNGQTRGSGSTPLVLTMETFPCGSGVEMMRPQLDKWYWITTQWDGSTRTGKMAVYDPNTWQLVGSMQTCGLNTSGGVNRISVGQYDNHGYASLDSEYYMDDLMIDSTNATFPLLPNTGSIVVTPSDGSIDCDLSTLQSAVNNASAGDTIKCKPGSWTWSSGLNINKGVILKGADNNGTTINSNTSAYLISYDPSNYSANTPFRVTGFVFDFKNSAGGGISLGRSRNDPPFTLQTNVRIDHNTFKNQNNWGGNGVIRDLNVMRGVVDNNIFDNDTYIVRVANPVSGGAWWNYAADPAFHTLEYGKQNASMYYEDNTINKVNDIAGTQHPLAGCQYSGRYIFRYNDISLNTEQYPLFDLHGNATAGGSDYSCFGTEMYGNKIVNTGREVRLIDQRGGRAVIFGNDIQASAANINIRSEKSDSINPVTTINPLTGRPYVQHVTESYYWNNKRSGANVSVVIGSDNGTGNNSQMVSGVDYFSDGAGTVTVGNRASRPTTCTPGTGYWETNDSNPNSLSGKVGVGANPVSGSLYRCSSSGTWSTTPFYTPLAYPHPIRTNCNLYPSLCDSGSVVTDNTPPTTPTGVVALASPSSINVSWNASTDSGSGVAGYKVFRCTGTTCNPSISIASVSNTSYDDTSISQNTSYRYSVSSYDNAANSSSQSLPAVTTVPPLSGNQVIPAERIANWQGSVGVEGGIPARTTICSTLNPGVTVNEINRAISNCPSGQTVLLNEGNYTNLVGPIVMLSNRTLRGSNPETTKLQFSSGSTYVSYNGGYTDVSTGGISIVSGYTKDSSQLTVANAGSLSVGNFVVISELNDPSIPVDPTGAEGNCGNFSSCGPYPAKGQRLRSQTSKITAINGNTITISPAMLFTFSSDLSPQVRKFQSNPIQFAGIEDVTIESIAAAQPRSHVQMQGAANSWVKNVKIDKCGKYCVELWLDVYRNEIRDSQIVNCFNRSGSDRCYGLHLWTGTGNLIENNVFDDTANGIVIVGSSGNVFAYNYMTGVHRSDDTSWFWPDSWTHGAHSSYNLWEGNDENALEWDLYWGSNSHNTAFRNRFHGHDSTITTNSIKTVGAILTFPNNNYMTNVGNVLGDSGFSNKYEETVYSASSKPIWLTVASVWGIDGAKARSTMLRHMNYDYFTNSTKKCSDTGEPGCNGSSGGTTLPSSLYLAAKPTWFGNVSWPAIGPDVSGLATKIPARVCFERGEMPNCLSGGGVSNPTGDLLIKLVGSNLVTSSAPAGVQSKVDSGSFVSTNPNNITALSTGAHTVSFTDVQNYSESYATCTYTRGSNECSQPNESDYSTNGLTCTGGVCSLSVNISGGVVTKIVPRYIETVAQNNPPVLSSIGTKSVNENAQLTFTISATDQDVADTLTYSATNLPSGSGFNPTTKTFTWTPSYIQSGTYQVTFSVTDGKATDTEVVSITVTNVNRPPTVDAGNSLIITLPATASLSAVASDQDGQSSLTYNWTKVSGPGTVTFSAPTAAVTTATFSIEGSYILEVSVSDGVSSATDTIAITVNSVPVETFELNINKNGNGKGNIASSPAGISCGIDCESESAAFEKGTNVTISAAANQDSTFTGWSGACVTNSVTCSVIMNSIKTAIANFIITSNKFQNNDRVQVVTESNGVTVRTSPSTSASSVGRLEPSGSLGTINIGSGFNNPTYANGLWWRYVSYDSGTRGWSAEDFLSKYVPPPNNPPVLSSIGTKSVNENAQLTFTISATDQDVADTLTYSATNLPSGSGFNPTTKTFTWTPSYIQSGTYQVTFSVTDGKATDTEVVSITVTNVNRPPTVDAGNNQRITLPATATLNGAGGDPDGTPITFEWSQVSGPTNAVFSSKTISSPNVTFEDQGIYVFRLTVKDQSNVSVTDNVSVIVIEGGIGLRPDTDQDLVPDNEDQCPNTPIALDKKVNAVGCPLPLIKDGINITDLSNVDINQVESFELSSASGKITFKKRNGVTYPLIANSGTKQLDLDTTLTMTQGRVSLDSDKVPGLKDKPATITLYNVSVTDPIILRDGATCSSCTISSYTNGTIVFDVPGFSEYTVIENPPPVVEQPSPVSSGGSASSGQSSGSSGGRIRDISDLLSSDIGQNNSSNNTTTVPVTPIVVGSHFSRTLYNGLSGNDVKDLQVFLNNNGYTISTKGAGSKGQESTYFGPATESALKRFQCAESIVCSGTSVNGYGVFGPRTRALINSRYQGGTTSNTVIPVQVIPTQPSVTATDFATYGFSRDLTIGSRGEDVRQLQIYLNIQGFVIAEKGPGSVGNESDYFGNLTQAALARFQAAKNINPPKGYFGKVTRAYIRAGE